MRKLLFTLLSPLLLLADASDLLYDDSEVAVIRIQVAPASLEWIYNNTGSDSMHLASVHFKNAHIDETIDQVGFRIRGNTSRASAKKSFKLSFNTFVSGGEFYGVDKMNLNGEHNDPSIIRSKLCWDIFQDIGMPASRAAHCAVYINDEYYGLYISIEHVDDEFLTKNFENDDGNLWKCIWPADLTYRGSGRAEDYHPYSGDTRPYELMTNEELYDYSKLANLINVINNTHISEFPQAIEPILDIADVLSYSAINILTGSWDNYWFLRNNYYLYHDPGQDRIRWIPYDYDNAFGIDWFSTDWSSVDPYTYSKNDGDPRPLMEKMMAVDQYRNLYTHMLEFYRERVTKLTQVEDRIDSLKTLITPWAELDIYRTLDYGFSIPDFHQSYSATGYSNQHVKQGLKEFINQRSNTLPAQLQYELAPPLIYTLDYWPKQPAPEDSIHVQVSIQSHPGLNRVEVEAAYGSQGTATAYPMAYNPVPNTTIIQEHDRWTVTLPPVGEAGQIRFQVLAEDVNGRLMRYPRDEPLSPLILGYSELELVINELLAKNDFGHVDPAGEHDDWIEIYNPGDVSLNLSGMYLSDKSDNLMKWQFPDIGTTIGPKDFLLVWCDEDGSQEGLHANFKLSATGETIILTENDGSTIIDRIEFGPQVADQSYGRSPDGADNWTLFADPTPGYGNVYSSVRTDPETPHTMRLTSFPNPFNASTVVRYDLPESGEVSLKLVNLRGEQIRTLEEGYRNQGSNQFRLEALDEMGYPLSSGIYLLHLNQGTWTRTHKIMLIR